MLKLSIHTQRRLAERQIALAWVEATVISPDWTAADPDPDLTRSFKAVAAFGGRVLRVVHRFAGDDAFVVTAMFDRGAKR